MYGMSETAGDEANHEIWNHVSREGMYGSDGIESLFKAS